MTAYEQALRAAGFDRFFAQLGWPFDEIMLAPADPASNPYAGYRWLILNNRSSSIAHGQVAFAIPPADQAAVLPWEEWFILDGTDYHQVFYLHPHPKCTARWTAPDADDQHPAQVLGREWHYYVDADRRPALMQEIGGSTT